MLRHRFIGVVLTFIVFRPRYIDFIMDRRLLFAYVATGAVLFTFFVSEYGQERGQDLGRRLTETFQQHKDLFPMDSRDFWGTVTVTLGLLVAAAGGIGGGGILVPLLILVYGFAPKYAVPLSNFTIVGSSITNMVLNIPKRHPDCDRPLVDWDLILVMEPLTMAGAVSLHEVFFHLPIYLANARLSMNRLLARLQVK